MSDISVTVVGSNAITNPVIGNGDTVNVTISATGEKGNVGDTGAAGPANSLKIGTVVTGTDAAATITGTAPSQTLALVLPQGATGAQGIQGIQGPSGPANSLSVGTVASGASAAVTITGTAPSQVASFVLPVGLQGATGSTGPATTVAVGTVTTAASSANAAISSVTTGNTVTLNFSIPRGADGTSNLADETPQPLGTATAGSATRASRADHVHAVPVIAYAALTGTPSTFAPSTHAHAVGDVTNLQTLLDAKQASGTYATLVGGTVPSSQLPSYVDDVLEAANYAALPATGESGKLYVAIDTKKLWRWSGSTWVEISASPGSTDAVVEGSTNLYFTTGRASAAAPVQSVNGQVGAVTISAGGIAWSTAPTTTSTTTTAGQIAYDANYLYVANATNQWRRSGLEDWTTPVITISVQPSSQSAISGTATFSVSASATQSAELVYQWARQAGGTGGWVDIASGLSATLALDALSFAANNGDKYRVTITTGAAGTGGTAVNGWLPAVVVELTPTSTLVSGEAVLTISAAISIITQPQAVSLTSGTSASFAVAATTPGTGLAYQWQSSPDGTNWTNLSGATTTTLGVTGITETGYAGLRYRCVVSSSGYTDATSNAAILTVAPITVTTQPAAQTGAPVAGTTPAYTAAFSAAATSPAGVPTIQWEVSTDAGTTYSDVSGATSSSLSLSALVSSDSAKRYRAKFERGGWATVRSAPATLTVPTDTITVTTQPSNTTASTSSYSATAYTLPSGTWNAVSVANGKFFATANDTLGGDYIATSPDGVTWTKKIAVLPYPGTWSAVLYGNGVYLTFFNNANVAGSWCATSTDGETWTARQISATAGLAVACQCSKPGAGGWFFASNSGTGTAAKYVHSPDGVTWTTTTLTGNASLRMGSVTPSLDGSQILVWETGLLHTSIATISASGVGSFAPYSLAQAGDVFQPYAATHDGTTWVVVGRNYNAITGVSAKFSSGSGWTFGTYFSQLLSSVAYRSGRYVAFTDVGIASSADGLSWVLRQSVSSASYASVIATQGGFYANNNGGASYTSPDGLTWTQRSAAGVPVSVAVLGNKLLTTFNPNFGSLVDVGGLTAASFSSAASTTFGSPALQWQSSTDGGATWANVAGAVSSPLSITPVSGDTGKRFRAVYTKASYTTVNSNPAILTVP